MKMKSKTLKLILKDSEKLGPGVDLGLSRKMTPEESSELDRKAGLQMISLRLPVQAIKKLKELAEKEGIKYQPYIRKNLLKLANEGEIRSLTESRVVELIEQRLKKMGKKVSGF